MQTKTKPDQENIVFKKHWCIPHPISHSLTNNMSSEIVLQLNIIVLLPPVFISKHSFEVVSEKVCVGGQVELEISKVEKR